MKKLGSGCGTVGRAIASNARDLGLNPVISKFYLLSTVLKRQKEKKKEAGTGPIIYTEKYFMGLL